MLLAKIIFWYIGSDRFRCSHSELFCKKGVLKRFPKFTKKHLYRSLFLIKLQASGLKETPTQKFSCRFFQIFKDHVSLQNNSGRLLLQIQYCNLRFKSYKIEVNSWKMCFYVCYFSLSSFVDIQGKRAMRIQEQLRISFHCHLEVIISSLGAHEIF